MPHSISRAIDEQVERLFETGDAIGRLDSAAKVIAVDLSQAESALESLRNSMAAIRQDLWRGVDAFGAQAKTLLAGGSDGGAKDALRKKAARISLVRKLDGIASEASEIQVELKASGERLKHSAGAFRQKVDAKNTRNLGGCLYEELADALFVLERAKGRMRQVGAKNQSIAKLINAINNPEITLNNETITGDFEKTTIDTQVEEELAKLKSGSVRS